MTTPIANVPRPYRMRVQLQQGSSNAWSRVADGPVAVRVLDLKQLLLLLRSDAGAGKIPTLPGDRATQVAFESAIQRMEGDLDKVPTTGVANVGNVKRKTFLDSQQNLWRIDVENLAGRNLVQ